MNASKCDDPAHKWIYFVPMIEGDMVTVMAGRSRYVLTHYGKEDGVIVELRDEDHNDTKDLIHTGMMHPLRGRYVFNRGRFGDTKFDSVYSVFPVDGGVFIGGNVFPETGVTRDQYLDSIQSVPLDPISTATNETGFWRKQKRYRGHLPRPKIVFSLLRKSM